MLTRGQAMVIGTIQWLRGPRLIWCLIAGITLYYTMLAKQIYILCETWWIYPQWAILYMPGVDIWMLPYIYWNARYILLHTQLIFVILHMSAGMITSIHMLLGSWFPFFVTQMLHLMFATPYVSVALMWCSMGCLARYHHKVIATEGTHLRWIAILYTWHCLHCRSSSSTSSSSSSSSLSKCSSLLALPQPPLPRSPLLASSSDEEGYNHHSRN